MAVLFGAIFTFTDMTVVYVLTRGGPNNSTQVLASWAFFRGIDGGDVAQGAAIALFLFPLLLAAAIAILRAVRRMEVLMVATAEMPASQPSAATALRRRTSGRRSASTRRRSLAAFSAPARSCGASITAFKQNRDLYNPENNPFLFNRPATPDHVLVPADGHAPSSPSSGTRCGSGCSS